MNALRVFTILVLLVFATQLLGQERNTNNGVPPNIVIMLADDLGYGDLGCYGHKHIKTPNIDALADAGWKCTQFYAAAPMCSPSRAGLLTGRTPNRTGVFDWIAHDGASEMHLPDSEITFARLLQNIGYATALHGKWHLNSSFNTDKQPQPDDHGFDYWFATQFNPNHLNPRGFVRNGKELGQLEGYACQIVVDDAIEWVEQVRNNDQPFFQFISFHEPHHPVSSPPDLVKEHFDITTENKNEAIYFANVENLDKATGRYLQTLSDLGLEENTIVIFTSDHGPQTHGKGVFQHSYGQTRGLKGRKRYLYEGGIRVPGIVRWPARLRPAEESTPIGFVDFLPTFGSLCGYATPTDRTIDGSDIAPLLLGQDFQRDLPLHWHFYCPLEGPQSVLRDGDFAIAAKWSTGAQPFKKGTRHIPEFQHLFAEAKLTNFQLFNILEDPAQEQDLSEVHANRLKTMSEKLSAIHAGVVSDLPMATK